MSVYKLDYQLPLFIQLLLGGPLLMTHAVLGSFEDIEVLSCLEIGSNSPLVLDY